jgi:hypothetical protein
MTQEASTPETADQSDPAIRVGSPFAVDPAATELPAKAIEAFYDVGPIRYTAMGAVASSVMVLAFDGAAAWWFPSGGVLIASLGCGLSLFGMASVYRITSIALLIAHLGMFLFSYSRAFG